MKSGGIFHRFFTQSKIFLSLSLSLSLFGATNWHVAISFSVVFFFHQEQLLCRTVLLQKTFQDKQLGSNTKLEEAGQEALEEGWHCA
jgi:hypothetical protein